MSKLIAFRLPADLEPLFAAKCAARDVGVTAALVEAVKLWLALDERKPAKTAEPAKTQALPAKAKPFVSRLKGEWKAP